MKKLILILFFGISTFAYSAKLNDKDTVVKNSSIEKPTTKNDNPVLFCYYQEEMSKFVLVNYILFQVQDGRLKGIMSSAAQTMSEYYLDGEYRDGVFNGKLSQIGCYEDCSGPDQKIKIQLNDKNFIVPEELKSFFDIVPVYNGKNFITITLETELRPEPSLNSEKFYNSHDQVDAEIIEIGPYEKINETFDVWYKVKINNEVAWVFGGLCSICIGGN
jgi:hypothetical protein